MQKIIVEALREVGIERLTDFQLRAREVILSGRDAILVAPTGSGKTEAAVIPIFERMLEMERKGITLLYVTPLRALNRDMLRRLRRIAERLGIRVDVRHGDTPSSARAEQSRNPPDVMITTPETFQILFLGKNLRRALKNVKFVVIDEVHELADSERGTQLAVAIERLREYAEFQTIAISATVRDPESVARFFGIDAEVVRGDEEKEYSFAVLKADDEIELIRELVESSNSALIFVNTRQTAEALGVKLKEVCSVEVHHGSLSREARVEAEERFARGELKALICTSSMELGIDIGHVDIVIQYNSPRQAVRLIQRVGRSGHGLGRISKGFIVASNFDDILESLAIAEMALKGELEEPEFHEMSLDVLANQICAIALEYGRIDAERVYRIVRRSYPYRRLSYEEFDEICRFLADIGRIFYDGGEIAARRATRRYFYDNVSMIPDEKHYKVIDVTTGKSVGVLDESFLSTFSGEVFAMKGELWRVVSVDDAVRVEPFGGEGEIPSWAGEEIPVPFSVAQRVGELRAEISEILAESRERAIERLVSMGANRAAAEEVVNLLEKQRGYTLPTHERITVEGSGTVVVNACFGHKVNEALGRVLAMLLSARRGSSVSVEIDPYRIKLSPAQPELVKELLLSIEPESVERLAEMALIDTRLMQWKVVNAARKFGLLEKDQELGRINLRNLVLKLRGTPIYREALREIFVERFDVDRLREVVSEIGDEVEISVGRELSPISLVQRTAASELLAVRSQEAILKAFRRRLENQICRIRCLNCGASYTERVGSFSSFSCIKCGSRMIAVYNAKRDEPSRRELFRIANLVMSYGKNAVYALNTYGIGVETAARILARYYGSEEEFFKALMKAEREFVRTRRFWD